MVSQDRHEVYLTFVTLGAQYLEYLLNGQHGLPGDPSCFLHAVEEGPWDVTRRDHMERLGPIIEGIRLRAEADGWVDRLAAGIP